jgi:hypothetical protein
VVAGGIQLKEPPVAPATHRSVTCSVMIGQGSLRTDDGRDLGLCGRRARFQEDIDGVRRGLPGDDEGLAGGDAGEVAIGESVGLRAGNGKGGSRGEELREVHFDKTGSILNAFHRVSSAQRGIVLMARGKHRRAEVCGDHVASTIGNHTHSDYEWSAAFDENSI